MAGESRLWQRVKRDLSPFGELIRIESPIRAGIPDVCYCLMGASGWMELKHVPARPLRKTTPLQIPLRPEQALFLQRWHRARGLAFLVLQVGDDVLLYDAPTAVDLHRSPRPWPEAIALARVNGAGKPSLAAFLPALRGVR